MTTYNSILWYLYGEIRREYQLSGIPGRSGTYVKLPTPGGLQTVAAKGELRPIFYFFGTWYSYQINVGEMDGFCFWADWCFLNL